MQWILLLQEAYPEQYYLLRILKIHVIEVQLLCPSYFISTLQIYGHTHIPLASSLESMFEKTTFFLKSNRDLHVCVCVSVCAHSVYNAHKTVQSTKVCIPTLSWCNPWRMDIEKMAPGSNRVLLKEWTWAFFSRKVNVVKIYAIKM